MTASFDGDKGDDPILSTNFHLIKGFTDTIVSLADEIQRTESPARSADRLISEKWPIIHFYRINGVLEEFELDAQNLKHVPLKTRKVRVTP